MAGLRPVPLEEHKPKACHSAFRNYILTNSISIEFFSNRLLAHPLWVGKRLRTLYLRIYVVILLCSYCTLYIHYCVVIFLCTVISMYSNENIHFTDQTIWCKYYINKFAKRDYTQPTITTHWSNNINKNIIDILAPHNIHKLHLA